MFYGSAFKKEFELAKSYGWEFSTPASPQLNWNKFNQTREKEIARMEGIYRSVLKNSQVDFIPGRGILQRTEQGASQGNQEKAVQENKQRTKHGTSKNQKTVSVNGKLYQARHVLIAVGGRPERLNIEGADLCLTSDDMFSLKQQPKSLLILGAGYIGLEFASIFQSLGTRVSLFFRKPHILSGFDLDLRKHLQEELEKTGIHILSGRSPIKVQKNKGLLYVEDDRGEHCSAEQVLMATGRKANTEDLNLEAFDIKTTKGGKILVNSKFETSCPGVFAIGDSAELPYQLTPTALKEGMFVSEYLFSQKDKSTMNYESVPSAVFSQPEAAQVGLSEEQAQRQGFSLKIYESRFRPLKISLSDSKGKNYMKLVVCKKTDRVLGCHIVGEGAGEILQGFAIAVKNRLKKSDWDRTVGIHPTGAEELVCLRDLRKSN